LVGPSLTIFGLGQGCQPIKQWRISPLFTCNVNSGTPDKEEEEEEREGKEVDLRLLAVLLVTVEVAECSCWWRRRWKN